MSSKPLELCGKFQSDITKKQDKCRGHFYVVKGPSRSLLSWETSQRLKLIQVTNAVEDTGIPKTLKEFSELTSEIDESVKPVIYQPGQSNVGDYASRGSVEVATADQHNDTSQTEHYVTSIAHNPVDIATVDRRDDTSQTEHYVTSIARNPVDVATVDERDDTYETEHHVAFIARNAVPKAMTLNDVEIATANDRVLQAVMLCMVSGRWHQPPSDVALAEQSRYENVNNELTCTVTVLLKSNRIVIPTALQNKTVDIAHEGHLGIVKTKALMREKVWFPSIDKLVETKVKTCVACQIAIPVTSREPLIMSTLPNQPCEEMSVDFAHVDGEILLLVIDDYSRFPFVEPVSSEASSAVIPKLDKIFATFGTPNVVKSDNGPPFNGKDFAKLADVLGFKHRKVTPLWPRANGEVERFVKTMKKCVKAAKSEGNNWRKEMQAFLRNYRTTPHSTTGVAPSTLFLKRAVRNKLPQSTCADPVADIVRKRDVEQKWKMKHHANRKRYVKPCDLEVGEPVLVKRPFTASKAHAPYESRQMTIVARKGSMITTRTNQGQNVTRNSSFFNRLRFPNGSLCSESSEKRICVPNGSLCSESSVLRDDFEPSDDIVTKDKPREIEPVVHPEPRPQLNVDPELPIIRRSTRVRKAPDVIDL